MPICLEEMFSPSKMEARTSEKGLRSVSILFISLGLFFQWIGYFLM